MSSQKELRVAKRSWTDPKTQRDAKSSKISKKKQRAAKRSNRNKEKAHTCSALPVPCSDRFFLRVFFALFCDFFQLSFLNRLGYPRGRFWEGKIFPKSTQEEPSWVQDGLFTPYLVKNSDFHGSLRFPMFFDDFCFQDVCENDPRST